ncbi:SDR family NAD(P)-dependent oxidoreductase [Noviherbaspirillum saxi]|uniref:SDR family NAD(P)-dependent oxidoreductase n=1 Tax=Noviherbaspirillum saxi TaxID=2320863 RepID=A0A3A3FE66_9BURK|nr:SDR family NAD(P)-dependent oxidoreductase [Noviherbaspirillum saxi]RJF91661.1 SDR family NAD(P)-dependent oxidoreductase [Noviherbaspirillum saxi]
MSSVVVVTGAAGALGKAVVEEFLSLGSSIIAVDVNIDALRAAYPDNGRVQPVAVDLTNAGKTVESLESALAGRAANVLCNIAGGFDMGPAVHETDDAMWRRMLDLNVATLINASRAIVPGMKAAGQGKIVNVAAASASSGKGAMGAYCASKGAVARLTESMAQELRDAGINVNAVAPSIIDTPANRSAMPDADPGKWVSLVDLASVIGFLASDRARAVHGAVVPVVGLS